MVQIAVQNLELSWELDPNPKKPKGVVNDWVLRTHLQVDVPRMKHICLLCSLVTENSIYQWPLTTHPVSSSHNI